jgi:DNA-binding IclR family transcriptional regulator
MLRALKAGRGTPEEVAQEAGLPLFRVRGGLREFVAAGLAEQSGDKYVLSAAGGDLLATLPA